MPRPQGNVELGIQESSVPKGNMELLHFSPQLGAAPFEAPVPILGAGHVVSSRDGLTSKSTDLRERPQISRAGGTLLGPGISHACTKEPSSNPAVATTAAPHPSPGKICLIIRIQGRQPLLAGSQ